MPEWPSGFPYFLQFNPEFCNKELMIWATFSSRSCFYWLYRASPSLAAKNTNQSDFTIAHLLMSMCRVNSWLLEKGVFYDQCVLFDKTQLAFALFHFVLQGQMCLLCWVFLNFLFFHFNTVLWKGYLFLVLVLEGVVGLHRTSQLQLLWHQWLRHWLGLLWCWIVCLGNDLRSFYCFWGCT